jgi:tetratricopeptide (TPR) repeat protein
MARSKKDPDRALAELDRSLAVRDHPKSHFLKGHIYREQNDWGAAADAYERAYAIDPKPALLIYRLSQALIHVGRLNEADEILRKGLKLHPGNRPLRDQVRALKRARTGAG